MANHYIRQDLERRLILLGLSAGEVVVFINVAVAEKLNITEGDKE
jgi:anaerobic selenocysteine-containing dehydrogenase